MLRQVQNPGTSIVDTSHPNTSENGHTARHGNVVTPEKARLSSSLEQEANNDPISPNHSSVSKSHGAEDNIGHCSALVRAIDFHRSMPTGSLDEACDPFSSNSTSDNDPHNDNVSGDSPLVCPQVDEDFSIGNNCFKPLTGMLENPNYTLHNAMEAPAMKPPAPADERGMGKEEETV
jgi:hypothetical protein